MSIWDYLLIIIVLAIVLLSIRSIKKRSKNMGCGGSCSSCSYNCPSKEINQNKDKN